MFLYLIRVFYFTRQTCTVHNIPASGYFSNHIYVITSA